MTTMGRKAPAVLTDLPVPWAEGDSPGRQLERFCTEYVKVPKGKGANRPMVLRSWQIELEDSLQPDVRQAGWMLPRGQGKSALVSAKALKDAYCGEVGASVVVLATSEEQARIVFRACVRMIELDPRLSCRARVLIDRIEVPGRGSSIQVLPARPRSLEGLDPTLAILDEFGVIDRAVYEVVLLAIGKRERSVLLGIGTPGPDWKTSVLGEMREWALEHPDDLSRVWREHSAAGFEDHPVDCQHCWELANPALGDFLYRSGVESTLPPAVRESAFRRARLCQFVDELEASWLPPSAWGNCRLERPVPDGARVVLTLDGSRRHDATALLVTEISDRPHMAVVGLWEPPQGSPADWRVPMLDVAQAVRDACARWDVDEVACDPAYWQLVIQLLADEGYPMVEFPQTSNRMTPATTGLYQAVINGWVTHDGDARLARHVSNATVKEDQRGTHIYKKNGDKARRIDLAVCAIMGHSRAAYLAGQETDPVVMWL